MAETIYSIPINESFDRRCGCPLCALRGELEQSSLEYVMGGAMMEPDVRLELNRLGFCREHYDRLLGMKNRLALALTLRSRLDFVRGLLENPTSGGGRGVFGRRSRAEDGEPLLETAGSCFVCRRIAGFEAKIVSNTVFLWKTDPAFREKLKGQPFFCLRHLGLLLREARGALSEKQSALFRAELAGVCLARLEALEGSLDGFTASYDHRNAALPLTDAQRSAVEDCIELLSGS